MLKKLKENTSNELKEIRETIYEQNENINRNYFFFNYGAEKYTNWIEKSIRGLQQQTQTAKNISKLEDRSFEIIESEDKKNEE